MFKYQCFDCGDTHTFDGTSNGPQHCPECGAKMKPVRNKKFGPRYQRSRMNGGR
jgi:DNA-directed RNA polymerase subunit RPC12/RpoP